MGTRVHFFGIFVLVYCMLVTGLPRRISKEVSSVEIDEKTAEQVWVNCRKELEEIAKSTKDYNLYPGDKTKLSRKRLVHNAINNLPSHDKQSLLLSLKSKRFSSRLSCRDGCQGFLYKLYIHNTIHTRKTFKSHFHRRRRIRPHESLDYAQKEASWVEHRSPATENEVSSKVENTAIRHDLKSKQNPPDHVLLIGIAVSTAVATLCLFVLLLFCCLGGNEPKEFSEKDEKPIVDTRPDHSSGISYMSKPGKGNQNEINSSNTNISCTNAAHQTPEVGSLPLPPGRTTPSLKPQPPPPPPKPPTPKAPPPPPPNGGRPPNPPKPGNMKRPPAPHGHSASGDENDPSNNQKTKLKPLFWDKMNASPDQTMVWHEIKTGSFQLDEEMMETLFGYASAQNKAERGRHSSNLNSQPKLIQIIDPKKAHNYAITLKALHVRTEKVCNALMEGTQLPVELIQILIKMPPTQEEELKLRLYNGDPALLGPAERFLKPVIEIPSVLKRLEALLFMSSLHEDSSPLKDAFVTLEVACTKLKNSRLFLKLLEAVLKTGNRMNVGTFRGGAQAIKLDSLLKLSDVKGTDGKTTLLTFVVQEMIRSEGIKAARSKQPSGSSSTKKTKDLPEEMIEGSSGYYRKLGLEVVTELSNELHDVKKAAIIDGDHITSTVLKLGNMLKKTEDLINNELSTTEEAKEFCDRFNGFMKHAETEITWMLEEEKRIMALVKSTGDYFHGNSAKDEGLRLFVIVRDFLKLLDNVCVEIRKMNEPPHWYWVDRLKICIGAARGLDYLHTGTGIQFGIIHRDVKSSNILLHESWAAKISDFGLSRIGPTNQPRTYVNTLVKGTFGYLDPNYFATGKLTRKSDVYAFGVVLFEVLCQKRPVDRSLEYGLATWAQDSIKEGNLKSIVDSDIRGEISPKCLKEFARIAERCLEYHPKHRPTMTEVIISLESVLTLQLQTPGKSIFTRIVDVFPFSSTPNSTSENSVGCSSDSTGTVTSSDEHVPPCGEIVTPNLKSFTFSELRSATRNFRPDTMLGEGGSGRVFKGWVDGETYARSKVGTGIAVAVKQSNLGLKEWQAKVRFLGKFSHPNLVQLVGYCWEDRKYFLVYEYMQEGSLENHLFTKGTKPLAWSTRIKIATGAARGLAFLHTTEKTVIYKDFKPLNILLDMEFNAKLSDFDLEKLGPSYGGSHVSIGVMGTCTYGYAAPEYIATGHLYVKSDIYGFGVVLLEIITGLRVYDTNRRGSQHNLVDWARSSLPDKQKLRKIIDPRVHIPVKAACITAKLILNCLEPDPKNRPSMEEVLVSLQEIGSIKSKPSVQSTGLHHDRRYQSPLHTRKGVAKKLLEEETEKEYVMWKGVKARLEVNTLEGFKTFMGMLKHAPTAMKYKDLLKTKIQALVNWFHREYMNCVFDAPMPPKIGSAEVCLFDLFELVEGLGGSEKISEKYQWDIVAMSFGFPACMKNKLRGIFERYLELLNSFYKTVMEEEMTSMEVGRAVDARKGIHSMGKIDKTDDVDGRKNEFGEEGCEEGEKETREKHMYEETEAEDHVNIVSDDGERLVITFEQEDVSSKEPSIEEYCNSEGEEDSAILDSDSE